MPQQKEKIIVWIFRNKDNFVKKSQGTLVAGMVNFKEADPSEPIVYLGAKSWCITDMKKKQTILFYDQISKMLFKPSDMANNNAEADMLTASSRNVILGGRDAQRELGIQDMYGSAWKFGLGVLVLIFLFGAIILYLLATNAPVHAAQTTTTIARIGIGGLGVNTTP